MRSFFRHRFKAKYFWSAFLVLGVLSISIGSSRLDPLIVKALTLQDRVAKIVDYAYTEQANLNVMGEDGARALLLGDADSASRDPVKVFPKDPFEQLAKQIDAVKIQALVEKERATALKGPLKPPAALPPVGIRRPAPSPTPGSYVSFLNPMNWIKKEPVQAPPEEKLPEVPRIVRIEWRVADPKSFTVVRSDDIGKATTESVVITSLDPQASELFKAVQDGLSDQLGIGKIGSIVAKLEEDTLGRLTHTGMKRVVPLNDPALVAVFKDFVKLKAEIESESEKRSVYPIGDRRATAVLEASEVYLQTQGEFYANYIRNAHAEDDATASIDGTSEDSPIADAEQKAERHAAVKVIGAMSSPFSLNHYLPLVMPSDEPGMYDLAAKKAKAIAARREARRFFPNAVESLNLRLNVKTALPLYKDDGLTNWAGQKIGKPFNVRHVSDGAGGFQKLELFLNAEEKRLIEYAILMKPESKHGYLKLLQTTALRERMTNRWSVRRMMSIPPKDGFDRKVYACGHDLVSYHLDSPKNVSEMENYSSLWQGDRFNDFVALIPKIVPSLSKRPLLEKPAYVDLILTYLSGLPEFPTWFFQNLGGDYPRLVSAIESAQAPDMMRIEEESLLANGSELFKTYNLPADELTAPAIAERTSWKAYELRKQYLADSLVTLSEMLEMKGLTGAKAMERADSIVEAALVNRQSSWKKDQSTAISEAVRTYWTPQFSAAQNSLRYVEFEKKLLPMAATGARAVQIQKAVEDALKSRDKLVNKPGSSLVSRDRTKAEYYTANHPSRIAYRSLGLKDHMVPLTPDQVSRLFYKKLELLADEDAPKPEREAVMRISRNRLVLKAMEGFFGELGGQFQQALENSVAEGGKSATSLAEAEIDESNTPLAKMIVPAVKKAVADFEKAMSTPPKKKSSEPRAGNRTIAEYGRLPSFRVEMHRAVAESTAPARPIRIPDLLSAEEENTYVANVKDREEMKRLLQEAFGLIGLSVEGAGGDWATGFKKRTETVTSTSMTMIPSSSSFVVWELSNYIAVERIVQMQMPAANILERMVGSALDQKILANIVENEAYARAPILALQNSSVAVQDKDPEGRWNRFVQGRYFVPSLLREISKYYKHERKNDNGWDQRGARLEILKQVYRASDNDRGKVEDFCEADIRGYAHDTKFAMMFKSITGLREAFASQGPAQQWDEEISKDLRSWSQRMLEDYIDPISMYLFVAIMLIILWQMAPLILGFMSAAGTATTFGGVAAAAGSALGSFAKIIVLLATGNLAPVTVLFSIQSFMMASVYCYQLPPQADYAFQVANSQVITDRVAVANREKLRASWEELVSSRMWARFAVGMEFVQVGVFTAPGLYRSLGIKGSRVVGKFTDGVNPELAKKVANEPLGKLIKEKGIRKGLAAYSERLAVAAKNWDRASSVTREATDVDIARIMVERSAPHMAEKEVLSAIYGKRIAMNPKTQEFELVSTGILKATEDQIAASRKLIAELQTKSAALKRSTRWAEARAYLRGLNYKYGKDAKYFSLIVAKDYDEAAAAAIQLGDAGSASPVLKQVMTSKNAREIQILVEFAKLRDLEYKAAYLEQQATRLATLGNGEITEEIVRAHLSRLSLADWQMHQKIILDAVRKPLPKGESLRKWQSLLHLGPKYEPSPAKVTRTFFKDLYKGFDYVAQDYRNLNPRMATLAKGVKNGVADLTIDKVGAENKLDPNDIVEHPEDYEFLTIKLDDL